MQSQAGVEQLFRCWNQFPIAARTNLGNCRVGLGTIMWQGQSVYHFPQHVLGDKPTIIQGSKPGMRTLMQRIALEDESYQEGRVEEYHGRLGVP
jgi:hypothetical protein